MLLPFLPVPGSRFSSHFCSLRVFFFRYSFALLYVTCKYLSLTNAKNVTLLVHLCIVRIFYISTLPHPHTTPTHSLSSSSSPNLPTKTRAGVGNFSSRSRGCCFYFFFFFSYILFLLRIGYSHYGVQKSHFKLFSLFFFTYFFFFLSVLFYFYFFSASKSKV